MKLTCVLDNCVTLGSNLWGEHGLAILVETPDGVVLWDTGTSGTVLLHNLSALGIDPLDFAAVAVSHGHLDHTGGLAALLPRVRPGLPLYGHPQLFCRRFSRQENELKSIGMSLTRPELADHAVLRLSADPTEVLPGVWTSGEIASRPHPEGRSSRHVIEQSDRLVPDPYRDDMALVLHVPDGLVLVCGCCHAGLLNTILHVERRFEQPIVAIAGGTHLAAAGEPQLADVGRFLLAMTPLQGIWLNHCSGERTADGLRRLLGQDRVNGLPAGSVLDLDELRSNAPQ